MNTSDAPWLRFSDNELACYFSPARALENAAVLSDVLTTRFISSSTAIRTTHPILARWDQIGVDSYLRLNGLAEDLRLIARKPNYDAVLRDLSNHDACDSAWHTTHVAALFERAKAGAVTEFIDSGNATSPDFICVVDCQSIPVEAKLLTRSEVEIGFHTAAEHIIRIITSDLASRKEGISVFVVIRDALNAPSDDEISTVLRQWSSGAITQRLPNATLRVEPLPADTGFTEQRLIYVLAPLHEKEYLRIRSPAKQASKQLRAAEHLGGPGMFALGLTHDQDPHNVISVLGNRMRAGNYRAIGAALLIKTGTHNALPRRSIVDLLEVRTNEHATRPLTIQLPLRPLDLAQKLTVAEPPQLDKPAYRHAASFGRLADVSRPHVLSMPDFRRLPADLLA